MRFCCTHRCATPVRPGANGFFFDSDTPFRLYPKKGHRMWQRCSSSRIHFEFNTLTALPLCVNAWLFLCQSGRRQKTWSHSNRKHHSSNVNVNSNRWRGQASLGRVAQSVLLAKRQAKIQEVANAYGRSLLEMSNPPDFNLSRREWNKQFGAWNLSCIPTFSKNDLWCLPSSVPKLWGSNFRVRRVRLSCARGTRPVAQLSPRHGCLVQTPAPSVRRRVWGIPGRGAFIVTYKVSALYDRTTCALAEVLRISQGQRFPLSAAPSLPHGIFRVSTSLITNGRKVADIWNLRSRSLASVCLGPLRKSPAFCSWALYLYESFDENCFFCD